LIDGGVDGLFVAGTAGLGSILTDAQHEQLVRLAVEHVAGRLPVLAGVLEPSTARTVERIRRIEALGPSAVVVVAPYYLTGRKARRSFCGTSR
jgi:4-hydroxy-tetrahydrodipicolinate synthase